MTLPLWTEAEPFRQAGRLRRSLDEEIAALESPPAGRIVEHLRHLADNLDDLDRVLARSGRASDRLPLAALSREYREACAQYLGQEVPDDPIDRALREFTAREEAAGNASNAARAHSSRP